MFQFLHKYWFCDKIRKVPIFLVRPVNTSIISLLFAIPQSDSCYCSENKRILKVIPSANDTATVFRDWALFANAAHENNTRKHRIDRSDVRRGVNIQQKFKNSSCSVWAECFSSLAHPQRLHELFFLVGLSASAENVFVYRTLGV